MSDFDIVRAWKDAEYRRSLSPEARALLPENPAGAIGQPPAPNGTDFQYSVTAPGRLTDASQFDDIVVRARPDASLLRFLQDTYEAAAALADWDRAALER